MCTHAHSLQRVYHDPLQELWTLKSSVFDLREGLHFSISVNQRMLHLMALHWKQPCSFINFNTRQCIKIHWHVFISSTIQLQLQRLVKVHTTFTSTLCSAWWKYLFYYLYLLFSVSFFPFFVFLLWNLLKVFNSLRLFRCSRLKKCPLCIFLASIIENHWYEHCHMLHFQFSCS